MAKFPGSISTGGRCSGLAGSAAAAGAGDARCADRRAPLRADATHGRKAQKAATPSNANRRIRGRIPGVHPRGFCAEIWRQKNIRRKPYHARIGATASRRASRNRAVFAVFAPCRHVDPGRVKIADGEFAP